MLSYFLNLTVWLLYESLSLKNDVNVPSKRNKHKNLENHGSRAMVYIIKLVMTIQYASKILIIIGGYSTCTRYWCGTSEVCPSCRSYQLWREPPWGGGPPLCSSTRPLPAVPRPQTLWRGGRSSWPTQASSRDRRRPPPLAQPCFDWPIFFVQVGGDFCKGVENVKLKIYSLSIFKIKFSRLQARSWY